MWRPLLKASQQPSEETENPDITLLLRLQIAQSLLYEDVSLYNSKIALKKITCVCLHCNIGPVELIKHSSFGLIT